MSKKEAQGSVPAKVDDVTASTDLVVVNDDYAAMLEEDAGAGQEMMGADDFAIPRIGIIQSLSPQRNKQKPEYIEDCEEGQIFENVGKTVCSGEEGILVIPVQYQKVYLEWADRDKGGGLVANHGRDPEKYNATTPNDKGQRITPEGNRIIPTAEYYVMILDEKTGSVSQAVLSMANTNLRHAKRWNSMINKIKYKNPKTGKHIDTPIYYSTYRLTTLPESNNKGSWFRWEITPEKPVLALEGGKDLYESAKAFREAIIKGMVKTADHEVDVSAEAESDEDPM